MRRLVLTMLFVAGISSAFAQTTTTTTTSSHTSDFPLIGLGSTETAEIDVVNVASNSSSGTAASCTGTIAFLTSAGATIGTATTFTLTSGAVSSAKLPFSSSGGVGVRTLIRGAVTRTLPTSTSTTSSTTSNPPCSLQFTLSIYDTTTGATHAVIAGAGIESGGGGFGR